MKTETVPEIKELICELCRNMYRLGWVSGTGGGISIKAGQDIVMAPSGVLKERMLPEDMFVLDGDGQFLEVPKQRANMKPPKLSECAPLFMAAYKIRGAGAVLHSHSINAVMATLLDESSHEFRITQLEMIKGIEGHGYFDELVVPIIDNTAVESQLTSRLSAAIKSYPKSKAVLVRRHGVYVWGRNWTQAKGHAECYDYLFEAAAKMKQLGLSPIPPSVGAHHIDRSLHMGNGNGIAGTVNGQKKRQRCIGPHPDAIVLDIEGTLAPIAYRTEAMIPYILKNARSQLLASYEHPQTQARIELLRQEAGTFSSVSIPPSTAGKDAVVDACCQLMSNTGQKKIPSLLDLQAEILCSGFERGELTAQLFDDVLVALRQWKGWGIKLYVYSSLPRRAQEPFFGRTEVGDARSNFSGYFDTTIGAKDDPASYKNILSVVGSNSLNTVMFVTDILDEAKAASKAGMIPVLIQRPGNAKISEANSFDMVETLPDLTEKWLDG